MPGRLEGRGASLVAVSLAVVLSAASASALAWAPLASPPAAGTVLEDGAERAPAPTAVAIGSLGVASGLIDLGLAPDRSLQVPEDAQVAGWYVGASRPGEPGPVVVVGHVDSHEGPGVFARLAELSPGDRVEVAVADGSTAVYAVTGVRQVGKDAFPTEQVYGAVPGDELRLITCGGPFDRAARSYLDNVVVDAVRV